MNTDKVIAQAKSWLGITEYDGRFVEIVNTYNEIPGARDKMQIYLTKK